MPAALSAQGVPIGVQLVAGWAEDARLLSAAAAYEQAAPPPRWPGLAD
jgi:Asp-tRNA(Asn)/Glu-tRNA(Gln) amidotransferase A subunit family amidase